jgi:VCBS repeat protein/centrosomal CEP192-like protein/pre-peptidase/ASPM-SPD-2-Hydin domain-containing protein
MRRFAIKALFWLAVLAIAQPLFATRVKDGGSSQNGEGSPSTCPDTNATPFFAELTGLVYPPSTCNPIGEPNDPDMPNPPSPYPNRVVTLSGSNFTVTITPALWEDGEFAGSSKATILEVTFSGQSGMTLQSLVIGSQLNNPAYVVCDIPPTIADCVANPFLLNPTTSPSALEPAGIALADTTTTRWDFSQFTTGNSLALVIQGFPSEFQAEDFDAFPLSNSLAPSSFSAANFLAIVKDSSNDTLTAGGLFLTTAAAATNDLFTNATVVTESPFIDFIDTSAAEPQEILSGTGAGGETESQQDPLPQDPNPVDPGVPCKTSWPPGSNRVFRSVWYKFSATATGSVTISTDGSRYDTGVYVFTGSPSSPTPVACNDDGISSTGFTIQSSDVAFNAVSGQTYYIIVSEVPPPVGVDQNGNPAADPLANDATLRFSLVATGLIGPTANPVPYVDSVQPPSAALGSNLTQLTILGTGFVSGASVEFNGSSLTPSMVTSNKIVVDNVAAPSGVVTLPLTVINPNNTPAIGTSNVAPFPVSKTTTSISLGRTDLSTGGGFSPIAADFNGDGKLDIASAGVGGNAVAILLGNGDGTFQTQQTYATGTQPISVVQGDFNGDGKLDLAVANEGGGNVSVLLGNGDGTFQTQVEYSVGSIPDALVAGDFNGDGKLDLVVANYGSSTVSLLLGNGDGSFRTHIDYAAGSQPISVAAGDFNGDGILDLAVAGGSVVSILIGNGDGTFKPAVTYTGSSPVWVITGDFNGDGKLDVATANAAADTVSIFLGNGDGTLQPRVDYATSSYAYSVATADLNGDGKLDLVAGTTSSSVPFFLGNGDGTFQNAKNYTSGVSNGALLVADLNNDGRLDLVPSLSNGISVLLQTPTATLSATQLTYATQLVGTTSAAQKVTLSNKGTAQLTIAGIQVTGDFQETNTCGAGLQPGTTCTITVTFTPTAGGTRTGSVAIQDNGNSKTQKISLTGTGTAVELTPASLTFGSIKVGTKSSAKKVTLTNKGTTKLSITSITITGTNSGDFTQTNTCGTGIGAGATCSISVAFKPTATGARSASVSVKDNGGGSPQSVALSGTGT